MPAQAAGERAGGEPALELLQPASGQQRRRRRRASRPGVVQPDVERDERRPLFTLKPVQPKIRMTESHYWQNC